MRDPRLMAVKLTWLYTNAAEPRARSLMKRIAGLCLGMWLASAVLGSVSADTAKSKFGPDAVPLPQAVDYLSASASGPGTGP